MILPACAYICLYLWSPEKFRNRESLAYAQIMAVHFFIIGKLSTIVSTAVNVPARRLSKHSIRDLLAIIGKLGSAGNKSYKKKKE